MDLDPRIQGHLRELLEASHRAGEKDERQAHDLALEGLRYAREQNDPYEIAVASSFVANAKSHVGHFREALDLWVAVRTYSEAAAEHQLLARSYCGIGNCHLYEHNLDAAEEAYGTGLRVAEQHQVLEHVLGLLVNLAAVYNYQERYHKAITTAYRLMEEIEHCDAKHWDEHELMLKRLQSYSILGMTFGNLGDFETALSFHERALKIATTYSFPIHLNIERNNIGSTYSKQGNYPQAAAAFLKALETKSPATVHEILNLLNLCICYTKIGDLEKAEKFVDAAEDLSIQSGIDVHRANILVNKGSIKLARNDPGGITMLLEGLDMKKRSGQLYGLENLLDGIWKFYKGIEDFENALKYHEEYTRAIKRIGDEKQLTFFKVHAHHENERVEQEKRIYELELEKSRIQLQHQERELALTASQLANQADLLSRFRNDLRKIVHDMADPIEALHQIKQKLKDLPCGQIDWAKFESEFVTVNPEFRRKLLEQFPGLTSQQTKICMLVRLGLKNAEIARLTCLSERSVEDHRLKLRKKLGLAKAQKLSEFLTSCK